MNKDPKYTGKHSKGDNSLTYTRPTGETCLQHFIAYKKVDYRLLDFVYEWKKTIHYFIVFKEQMPLLLNLLIPTIFLMLYSPDTNSDLTRIFLFHSFHWCVGGKLVNSYCNKGNGWGSVYVGVSPFFFTLLLSLCYRLKLSSGKWKFKEKDSTHNTGRLRTP